MPDGNARGKQVYTVLVLATCPVDVPIPPSGNNNPWMKCTAEPKRPCAQPHTSGFKGKASDQARDHWAYPELLGDCDKPKPVPCLERGESFRLPCLSRRVSITRQVRGLVASTKPPRYFLSEATIPVLNTNVPGLHHVRGLSPSSSVAIGTKSTSFFRDNPPDINFP